MALAAELAKAGEHPEVVLEAIYGWYWAADVIEMCGGTVHLSHPLGNNWGNRRVKNNLLTELPDATDLVDLLRMGRLAEGWVAPPPLRVLRGLVRYRGKLVRLRTTACAPPPAHQRRGPGPLGAREGRRGGADGRPVRVRRLTPARRGRAGKGLSDPGGVRGQVESLRDLIELDDREIFMVEGEVAPFFAGDLGYHAVQAIPGVGPVLAAVFVAEIGDIGRFTSARHLASWAGLTPTHHESDEKVRRGHITKQGSRLVRWAAVEAVARQGGDAPIPAHHRRVGERRGKQIGRVAAARKLLTRVYYGLRDGEVRCLAEAG